VNIAVQKATDPISERFMVYSSSGAVSRVAVLLLVCGSLLCCGGTRILDKPLPLAIAQPVASLSDENIAVFLDWVIVRDGPGTWARDADWDEYFIRLQNRSTEVLTIMSVAIYDSTLYRQETNDQRSELVSASKLTARRYAGQGVEVKAGIRSDMLLVAAGAAGGITAVGLGSAAMYMSSTAAAATLGALVAAPILITSGLIKAGNTRKVSKEIMHRHTLLPLSLVSGEERVADLFFPLTPSPARVEVIYQLGSETDARILNIDTSVVMDGLHIVGDSQE
jgi:hypothetical protein